MASSVSTDQIPTASERVLAALQQHGFRSAKAFGHDPDRGLTHAQVAEMAKLSRPSVYAAERELGRSPVLTKIDADTSKRKLLLRSDAGFALGVEVGTYHARVVIADFNGQLWPEKKEKSIPNPYERPEDVLKWITDAITEVLAEADVKPEKIIGVGVSRQAPVGLDGKPHPLGLTNKAWQDVDIKERLTRRHAWIEDRPFVVNNDANLSALTEKTLGAARDLENFVYIKWSDGISIGLVLSGKVYLGTSGYAGEFGHLRESENGAAHGSGRPCPRCGKPDCLENMVGANSLLRAQLQADDRALENPPDELVTKAAEHLWDIIQKENENDREKKQEEKLDSCRDKVKNAAAQLGHAVASIVDVLDPAALVLGGTLGTRIHDDAHLLLSFRRGLERRMMGLSKGISILPPKLHGRSAAHGAALRVLNKYSSDWASKQRSDAG